MHTCMDWRGDVDDERDSDWERVVITVVSRIKDMIWARGITGKRDQYHVHSKKNDLCKSYECSGGDNWSRIYPTYLLFDTNYPMSMLTTSSTLLNIIWTPMGIRKCRIQVLEQWNQGIIDVVETRVIACPDKNLGRPCRDMSRNWAQIQSWSSSGIAGAK